MVATAVAARLSCSNVNCNALCSRLRLPFACLQLLQLSADTCMQNTHSSIRLTAGTRPGTARGQQHFFALWFLHCAENLLHGTLSRQVVIWLGLWVPAASLHHAPHNPKLTATFYFVYSHIHVYVCACLALLNAACNSHKFRSHFFSQSLWHISCQLNELSQSNLLIICSLSGWA